MSVVTLFLLLILLAPPALSWYYKKKTAFLIIISGYGIYAALFALFAAAGGESGNGGMTFLAIVGLPYVLTTTIIGIVMQNSRSNSAETGKDKM